MNRKNIFQKVASYINKKMDELSAMPGYSRQPMETKHTLISLNITDDYFKAKKQAEVLNRIYSRRIRRCMI